MRFLLTGATGFIGTALVSRLLAAGHSVAAWVRNVERARNQLGPSCEIIGMTTFATPEQSATPEEGDRELSEVLERTDVVINLAGESVVGARWTVARKRSIVDSRIALTDRLVAAIRRAEPRPHTLLSASAVGYYGSRASEPITEKTGAGDGFLAELCRDWEASAMASEADGLRVVLLRIGLVLGMSGGVLAKLLPSFRIGLGAQLGDGQQYMPWVHIEDATGLMLTAAEDESWHGALNLTAPEPVTNAAFTKALSAVLSRPALLRAPALALRLALGESAGALVASHRALPQVALDRGYNFAFSRLDRALEDLIRRGEEATC